VSVDAGFWTRFAGAYLQELQTWVSVLRPPASPSAGCLDGTPRPRSPKPLWSRCAPARPSKSSSPWPHADGPGQAGLAGPFFEDFEVGDIYEHPLGRTVLAADNVWFTLLTQNTAKIHFDAHYASKTEWGKPLVDSTFTLALVTGQSVTDVSQNVMANLGWDTVRLPNPVFEGDTIYSRSEVLEARESKSRENVGVVRVRTTGVNQDGTEVITFERTLLVYKRDHARDEFRAGCESELTWLISICRGRVARGVAGGPQGVPGHEKEFTRARDALNADRRRLPMVKVDKDYEFTAGGAAEADRPLRGPRPARDLPLHVALRQESRLPELLVVRRPDRQPRPAPHAQHVVRLHLEREARGHRGVQGRMGWTFPWYSSLGSDFNYDFHVTFDESKLPFEYNFADRDTLVAKGLPIDEWEQPFDLHGLSVFLRVGEDVFHTYSPTRAGPTA
jgi:acyl dehydratase